MGIADGLKGLKSVGTVVGFCCAILTPRHGVGATVLDDLHLHSSAPSLNALIKISCTFCIFHVWFVYISASAVDLTHKSLNGSTLTWYSFIHTHALQYYPHGA